MSRLAPLHIRMKEFGSSACRSQIPGIHLPPVSFVYRETEAIMARFRLHRSTLFCISRTSVNIKFIFRGYVVISTFVIVFFPGIWNGGKWVYFYPYAWPIWDENSAVHYCALANTWYKSINIYLSHALCSFLTTASWKIGRGCSLKCPWSFTDSRISPELMFGTHGLWNQKSR